MAALHQRGPDNAASLVKSVGLTHVWLGHTRLKIIDLSDAANQPLVKDGVYLLFNGEIYNFLDIRQRLTQCGVVFRTSSDSEVLLQAYCRFGLEETLKLIRGMYAFCILDLPHHKMYAVRDRVGIKPLYVHRTEKGTLIASEVKAMLPLMESAPTINADGLVQYLYHRYVPEPMTIYNEIEAIDAGEYLEIDLAMPGAMCKKRYWSLCRDTIVDNENEVVQRVEELLHEIVRMQLISDVPLAIAFSGGLDSSLLLAIAREYKPDIVGVLVKRGEDDIDWIYAKRIAKHLGSKLEVIDFADALDDVDVERIQAYYDVPIACSSVYGTYLVFKAMSREFKVSLSGDGGDELFGGYLWYLRYLNVQHARRGALRRIVWRPLGRTKSLFYDLWRCYGVRDSLVYKRFMLDRFSKQDIEALLGKPIDLEPDDLIHRFTRSLDDIKNLMYVDFHTFLRYTLRRADLSSMACSMENRVPYLDRKLVDFMFSVDPSLICRDGQLKYILKRVAEKYLPRDLIDRPKKGFSTPITSRLPIRTGQEFMLYTYRQWHKHHAPSTTDLIRAGRGGHNDSQR